MAFGKNPSEQAPAPAKKVAAPATAPTAPAAPATAPVQDAAKGRPGRKPGSVAKPRPALDLGALSATAVSGSTMAQNRRQRGERDATQKALDTMVERQHKAWVEAGKPSQWAKMPGIKLSVPAEQFDTLQYGLRKAANYFDLKLRFGKVSSVRINGVDHREVVFVVTDRPATEVPATARAAASVVGNAAVTGTGQTES